MFLSNLAKSEVAELFLKMACYVAISEGDFSEFEKSVDWENMTDWKLGDFYTKFIDAGFSEIERKKLQVLIYDIKSGLGEYDHINSVDMFISEIKEEIRVASEKFLDSIKENKDLNKKIMLSMIEAGADVTSVKDAAIKAALLIIPETKEAVLTSMMLSLSSNKQATLSLPAIMKMKRSGRSEILVSLVSAMAPSVAMAAAARTGLREAKEVEEEISKSEKNPILDMLTLTQKKTMVFELVGMGNVDEKMGHIERALVEAACYVLGVEKDFIEDSEEAIKSIISATTEALELINE